MDVEPNLREPTCMTHGLADGDFVEVRFNCSPHGGFIGRVVEADETFLRLVVHEGTGTFVSVSAAECLVRETLIPWPSIAWVAHKHGRPVQCACLEA